MDTRSQPPQGGRPRQAGTLRVGKWSRGHVASTGLPAYGGGQNKSRKHPRGGDTLVTGVGDVTASGRANAWRPVPGRTATGEADSKPKARLLC